MKYIIFAAFLFLATLSFTKKINLTTADLGRHIKNGEVVFRSPEVLSANFYSYTNPDYPVINHHWLTGVVFYFIHQFSGFTGLSLFYSLLFCASVCLFFKISMDKSSFSTALFAALLSVPLITSRQEIRPEGISYLFLAVDFFLLHQFRLNKISFRALWIIPVLQILWVNFHILFILGLVLIGAFFLDEWINGRDPQRIKMYLYLFLAASLACLVNPFGIKGMLIPFTIFREYGYMLAENQAVVFMHRRFPENPLWLHFEVFFAVCFAALVVRAVKAGFKESVLNLMLFVFFSALAWKAIRSIPLFGFVAIPILSESLHAWIGGRKREGVPQSPSPPVSQSVWRLGHWGTGEHSLADGILIIFSSLILLTGFTSKKFYYSPYVKNQWEMSIPEMRESKSWLLYALGHPRELLGLESKVNASAEFLRRIRIEGPIFNNYDIGGYLIYHLFPKEKVFVDNRPEAYPVSFFQETFIKMQEDELLWQRMDARYQFNAIYFFRHDLTPWGQPFLIKRLQDPQWAPVYVDDYVLILLKRNEKNALNIQFYELPQDFFLILPT